MGQNLQNNSKLTVLVSLTILLLFACDGSDPSPADLVPANLSQYDPNVITLVERQMSRIESDPHDAANYAELGMIYEANELWPSARNAYAKAVELQPVSTWWPFHLAVAMRNAGDLEGAMYLLQQLATSQPTLAPVQQRLGEALTEAGELAAAATAYQQVIDQAPDSPQGYHGLGEVRLLQRDFTTAAQLLERAVALDPRYRGSHYMLGLAYRGLGKLDEAQSQMELGVDVWPRYLPDPLTPKIHDYVVNLPARRNMAAAMLQSQPAQTALLLEQVLNEQPGNTTDLNNLAIAYMRLGRLNDAWASLEEARRLAPEKFQTWLNLSSLAMRGGDPEAAVSYAKAAVERAPTMAQTHVALAMAEAETGNLEAAAMALEDALQFDARDPQIHGMLAEVSVQLGRWGPAEQHFQSVLEIRPRSLTAMLGLGRLYVQQGDREKANAMLLRANQLAPGNARVAAFGREIRQGFPQEQK